MAPMNPIPIRRLEARRLFGISERTFASLEAEGIFVPTSRGIGRRASVYDLPQIVQAYVAHLRSATVGEDREARARRDRSQAGLNELRLAERKKELLPRDQVVREGRAFVLAVRAKLLAMPRAMVIAGIVPPEKQLAVRDLIYGALTEMSRWTEKTNELEAAAKKAEKGKVR